MIFEIHYFLKVIFKVINWAWFYQWNIESALIVTHAPDVAATFGPTAPHLTSHYLFNNITSLNTGQILSRISMQ